MLYKGRSKTFLVWYLLTVQQKLKTLDPVIFVICCCSLVLWWGGNVVRPEQFYIWAIGQTNI